MACPLELVFASGALYCITVAICCRTTQVQQARVSYASPDTDELCQPGHRRECTVIAENSEWKGALNLFLTGGFLEAHTLYPGLMPLPPPLALRHMA
jgi:hypothetical protein